MSNWTSGLNPAQKKAVLHNKGPLLILAGAGSGKTTVLVSRAGRLIDEGIVAPEKLCVLTFTNKAARELKSRVKAKLGSNADKIFAGTFHSFGMRLLREFHEEVSLPKYFGIVDSRDTTQLLKELLKNLKQGDKTAYDADKLLEILSRWREHGRTTAERDEEYEIAAEWVLPKYLQKLNALGAVDFDGLILQPLQLMEKNPNIRKQIQERFDQIMVDEFQDTNVMQMRLVQLLAKTHKNLAVVGDDDQSIYGWRGACVQNILDFPKLYSKCKVVRLETNYRSEPAILDLANAVIKNNVKRHDKTLRAHSKPTNTHKPEVFVLRDEVEELEHVSSEIGFLEREGIRREEIAILFRSNTQGALIEAELRKNNIPYRMRGGMGFFDRKETRDVMAYLRCATRPHEVAFRRILNTPPRGIGDKAVERLTQLSKARKISFFRAAKLWREAGIEKRAGLAIENLFQILAQLPTRLISSQPGTALLGQLDQMGYRKYLEKNSPDALVATRRWRFIETFADVMDKYLAKAGKTKKALLDFLDAMELRDTLEDEEEEKEKVHLLTFHACKGLEFDAVILMGVEEDIIPHKTLGTDIAEERRLFYVGVTRARKRLILTRSGLRKRHGKVVNTVPSRFLEEVPKSLFVQKQGMRPLNPGKRKELVANLFKHLDKLDQTPTKSF